MLNTPDLWRVHYPVLKPDGNKYDRGSALIYGGEVMTGAARLAARAAQRIGAGLVTIAASSKAVPIYSEALESVIVREANDVMAWNELLADPKRNAALIGPGLGLGALQAELTLAALAVKKPCVLDADALSNFADDPEKLFGALHNQCVLTPHEGEFKRLFGTKINANAAKQERALAAAKLAACVVLLKGAETIIAAPDGQYVVNNNAPPWLATAGAGDVLAGIILGLLAQKTPVFWATAAAAWIHGNIASTIGPGLIAEDLVEGMKGKDFIIKI
jgi:NAD(P)H-hydrate epimerase